jgi:hypothetical protein
VIWFALAQDRLATPNFRFISRSIRDKVDAKDRSRPKHEGKASAMGILALADEQTLKGRAHYLIDVDGMSLAYCYIRKNACSAFKKFIIDTSDVAKNPDENDMRFMARAHLADLQDVRAADHRICILRDPIDRAASVYVNKFVAQTGNADIFKSYADRTGRPPHLATFSDFVEYYLSLPLETLDVHVYPQASHLMPVDYDVALMIDQVYSGMVEVLGVEIADVFFARKMNATRYHPGCTTDKSRETAEALRNAGMFPARDSLCTEDLAKALRAIYAEDYSMIARLVSLGGSAPQRTMQEASRIAELPAS